MTGNKIARLQREQNDTELVPPSEESSGQTLDPACYDEAAPQITMMSERGERNARAAGNQVDWRSSMIRRQP